MVTCWEPILDAALMCHLTGSRILLDASELKAVLSLSSTTKAYHGQGCSAQTPRCPVPARLQWQIGPRDVCPASPLLGQRKFYPSMARRHQSQGTWATSTLFAGSWYLPPLMAFSPPAYSTTGIRRCPSLSRRLISAGQLTFFSSLSFFPSILSSSSFHTHPLILSSSSSIIHPPLFPISSPSHNHVCSRQQVQGR